MMEAHAGRVAILESVHPIVAERLTAAGFEVLDALDVTRSAILGGVLHDVAGIIVRSRFMVDAELMDAMPALRFVGRSGSGLENIDLEAAAKRAIAVHNSPEGNAAAVGEHVIGMMLALLNKFGAADASIRAGRWEREAHRGRELGAMTVGIVGYGHMGTAVAERLAGFGCRVLAYDKYKRNYPTPAHVQEVATMEALHAEADIVSLHLPLTEETSGLVDQTWLAPFRRPILLINAARGPIVSTPALLQALRSGAVFAAGLDVLEYEGRDLLGLSSTPAALQELLALPQTLFTPHVAGWTVESLEKLGTVLVDKITGTGTGDSLRS